MAKMRAVQVSHPNGPLELVERPLPEPGADEVRIKVQACGVCHSDSLTKEGVMPGLKYPRVPGHEVVQGWYSGTSIDSQETLAFSVLSGVRSMNEVFPLERATEAYERMMSGQARFRVVLTTGQ